MDRDIWIAWQAHTRSRTLSRQFDVELHEFVCRYRGVKRYLWCIAKTLRLFRRRRPSVCFVQSPSIVLALLAVTVGRLWVQAVVIDAHNAGIFPFEGKSRLVNKVNRKVLSLADAVLVSNEELRDALRLSNVVVLPDPLPSLRGESSSSKPDTTPNDVFVVTFVTSWAHDEPYVEVIRAAEMLGAEFVIQATGKPPADLEERVKLPGNFRLTGFLGEQEYAQALRESDAVLVLTRRDSCLTCGAYEAVSLERPLILSDTTALRTYFGTAALYSQNSPAALRDVLSLARKRSPVLLEKARNERQVIDRKWSDYFSMARSAVDALR